MTRPQTPALLADATWYGTLAAARDLGAHGVAVALGSDARFAPARWSRHVRSVVRCPSTNDHAAFARWLHEFGERHPGHVLYPTSDDAAWVVSSHRETLSACYRLYSPPPEVLGTLLDKGRLLPAGARAGLEVPQAWMPADEAEVERLAREAPFPLFVKPRTQLLRLGSKGRRVDRPEALAAAWRALRAPADSVERLGPAMRGAEHPLVQAWYPASESIFTVDGFMTRAGEMVALGCTKRLQRPRRLGAGIVFEDAPVPASVLAGLQKMLRGAGFFGVYDAEFVRDRERLLLIDVNPRFYNHMAFEIDRGLPLPWLAYLGALGDEAGLAAAMAEARRRGGSGPRAYVHRLATALMLTCQGLAGAMPAEERRRWREWLAKHSGQVTDPASTPGDRLPAVADAIYNMVSFLRHPRAFVRELCAVDPTARPPTGRRP